MRTFLSIAASDSSGGAGIQQDLRVAEMLGYFPLNVITALTLQDFQKVYRIVPVDIKFLADQIDLMSRTFSVDCCKIGVLTTIEQIELISAFLKTTKIPVKVVDTVFKSSGGQVFLDQENIKLFKNSILPYATFITPNKTELEDLSGYKIQYFDEAIEQALNLHNDFGCNIYIKGGHFDINKNIINEALVYQGITKIFTKKRYSYRYSHGTGCAFSTAFSIYLHSLSDPVLAARKASCFVSRLFNNINKKGLPFFDSPSNSE